MATEQENIPETTEVFGNQEPETQTNEQEVVNTVTEEKNIAENNEVPATEEPEIENNEPEVVDAGNEEQNAVETAEVPAQQEPETQAEEQEIVNTDNKEIEEKHKEIENAEAKVFIDLFHAYDTQKAGRIKAEHLYEIATMIGKDSHNVDAVLEQAQKTKEDLINLEEYQHLISELEKPEASIVESQGSAQSERVLITPDPKVLEFIKLLHAFQKKCEKEGKYGEAKLAQDKIEETKLQEILRQENKIRQFQDEELAQVEAAQQAQLEEFNKVWDKYMSDYEEKALESLEKLKEKHINEVAELHERLKRELVFHFKSSKQLIDLRQKEEALVKLKKYNEAERVKAQADALEEFERKSKEKEIEEITEKKTVALRQQQQKSLTVLVKRIQKDREQQLKNRDQDSQKLLLKNKNLRNELISKHANETKNSLEVVRNNLSIVNAIYLNQPNKKLNTSGVLGRSSVKSAISNESPNKLTDQAQRI